MPDFRYPVAQGPDYAISTATSTNTGAVLVTRSGFSDREINSGETQDLWPIDGNLVYLDSEETIEVVSTSPEDNTGQDGAHTLYIEGLNDSFEEINEFVVLDGTNAVDTINQYRRILTMTVVVAGDAGTNKGAITATSKSGGHIQSHIVLADGVSSDAHYTIPAGKTGVLRRVWLSGGKGDEVLMIFTSKDSQSNVSHRTEKSFLYEGLQSFDGLIRRFDEKTDIKFEAEAVSNKPRISVIYQLFLFNK